MKSRKLIPQGVALVAVLCALAVGAGGRVTAQTPPAPPGPPPTHDYDPMTPGVQGPTAPALRNWVARHMRTQQVTPLVLVPLADLQAMLPPGYEAVPSAPGATTAVVNLGFIYQVKQVCADGRVLGPANAYIPFVAVQNTSMNRTESFNLDTVFTDRALVEAWNGDCGVGGARFGEIAFTIQDQGGRVRLTAEFHDAALQAHLRAAASVPATFPNRLLADPAPTPARALTGWMSVSRAFRLGTQGDQMGVAAAAAAMEVQGEGGMLVVPGHRLRIVGLGAGAGFARNFEVFMAPE